MGNTESQVAAPSASDIKDARTAAGMTQGQAAELVGVGWRTWAYWEAGEYQMPLARWELFQFKMAERGAE